MPADDPKILSARIIAAERAGDAALASDLRRHLIANHPNSPEAERARAVARLEASPLGEPRYEAASRPPHIAEVRVVDIDVKFWSMVVLLVKLAIAAIPAMIIVTLIGALVLSFIGSLGTAFR